MTFHPAVLLAALAHLALCTLIAAFSLKIKVQKTASPPLFLPQSIGEGYPSTGTTARTPGLPRRSAALLLSLLPWLCIPNGAFPALFNSEFGAPAALLCLGAAGLLSMPGGSFRKSARQLRDPNAASIFGRRLLPVPCLGVSLVLLALYARQRGLPGDLLSLDSYAAMPLRELTEGREKIGLLLLASANLLALLSERRHTAAPCPHTDNTPPLAALLSGELRRLATCGILLCLFMPLNFIHMPTAPFAVFLLNAAFFQLRLLCLEHSLCLLAEHIRPPLALPCLLLAAGALCLFGAG